MDCHDIAAALREIADWLDFEDDGKKSFRARAYRKGADAIEQVAALEANIRGLATSLRLENRPAAQ